MVLEDVTSEEVVQIKEDSLLSVSIIFKHPHQHHLFKKLILILSEFYPLLTTLRDSLIPMQPIIPFLQ